MTAGNVNPKVEVRLGAPRWNWHIGTEKSNFSNLVKARCQRNSELTKITTYSISTVDYKNAHGLKSEHVIYCIYKSFEL